MLLNWVSHVLKEMMSPYIRAKFRKVTKKRHLALSVRVHL